MTLSVLTSDLCSDLLALIQSIRKDKNHLTIALSGGSSPLGLYQNLNASAFDFSQITFTLVDDRHVSHDHPDSNVKLVQNHLIGDRLDISLVPIQEGDTHWQADIAILGMGEDGHFASLFPQMMETNTAFDENASPQILATSPMGNPALPRLTMNMAMIAQIPHLILLLRGQAKHDLFKQALAGECNHLPIGKLMASVTSRLKVYDVS